MEFDLSKFFGAFFEEAEEHLATLERLLLELDLASPDTEDLNAIFRAAHSIKGGAGTFGFTDLAALTHILENLLDRVRKGAMRLESDMVDLFLRTGDVLAGMVAVHRDGAAPNPVAVEEVTDALKALEAQQAAAGTGQAAVTAAPPEAGPDAPPYRKFQITLRLDANTVPDQLLTSLGNFGLVEESARITQGDMLNIDLTLGTYDTAQDINDALAFVLTADRFDVREVSASVPAPIAGEGETFGFFDDEPAPPAPAGEGDAFGFFDSDPPSPAPEAEADATAAQGTAYGFFEPLPAVSTAPQPGAEGTAYGFLDKKALKAADAERQAEATERAAQAKPEPSAEVNQNRRATDKTEGSTIRVDVGKIDQLLNFVGELVITQSMLAQSAADLDPLTHARLLSGIDQLQRNTRELQESVMSVRMMPMSTVFSRFPRVVRDLAGKLGKKVELRLVGEQTEIDKGCVEKLVDPLTHLVRNSLDHGIESIEKRKSVGKPETGMLTLCAYQQGGNVVIEVRDDGAGLNRDRILAKARESGLAASESMSDQEVWMLIFEAGFSTAAEITDVSGRGVGMDVVRKNIQSMGGNVEIESMEGVGATMRIRIPLTLAILDGMLISVGGETYILPLGSILESLQPTPAQCKTVTGSGRVIQVREEYLPLIAMHEVLGCTPRSGDPCHGIVVIIEYAGQRLALWADELLGQQQVVVKSLESNYRRVPGMSGATILGDGQVALIVDVSSLSRSKTNA
ncbi:MAG: chemotaxis protein CheW [Burkholderiales bacterium]|nr:chemotaxis protein CheW [Burkholderiales bacterium]